MPLSSSQLTEVPILTAWKDSNSDANSKELAVIISLSDIDTKLSSIFEQVKQQITIWGKETQLRLELTLISNSLCGASEKQAEGFFRDKHQVKLEPLNEGEEKYVGDQLQEALDYAHYLEEMLKKQREEFSTQLERIQQEAASDSQELVCMKNYYQNRDEESRLQTTVENNLQSQVISSLSQKLEKTYQLLAKYEGSRSKSRRSKKLKKHSYDEGAQLTKSQSCPESTSGFENLFLLADQTLSHETHSPAHERDNDESSPITPYKQLEATPTTPHPGLDQLFTKQASKKENRPENENRLSELFQEDTLPDSPDNHFTHTKIPETPNTPRSLMLASSGHTKKLIPKLDTTALKSASHSQEFLAKAGATFKPISPLTKKEVKFTSQLTQTMSPLQHQIKYINAGVAPNSSAQFPFTNLTYPGIQRKGRSPYVKWTPEEDALLRKAVAANGCKNWEQVAKAVPGRSYHQCRQRWIKVLKNGSVQANYGGKFLSTEIHVPSFQGPATPTRTPTRATNNESVYHTPTPMRKPVDILPTPQTSVSSLGYQTLQHPIAIAPKPPIFHTAINTGSISPPPMHNSLKVHEECLLQGPVMGVFPPAGVPNAYQEDDDNDGRYKPVPNTDNIIQSSIQDHEEPDDLLAGLNALASVSTAQSEVGPASLIDISKKRPRLELSPTFSNEKTSTCSSLSKILRN